MTQAALSAKKATTEQRERLKAKNSTKLPQMQHGQPRHVPAATRLAPTRPPTSDESASRAHGYLDETKSWTGKKTARPATAAVVMATVRAKPEPTANTPSVGDDAGAASTHGSVSPQPCPDGTVDNHSPSPDDATYGDDDDVVLATAAHSVRATPEPTANTPSARDSPHHKASVVGHDGPHEPVSTDGASDEVDASESRHTEIVGVAVMAVVVVAAIAVGPIRKLFSQ